MDEGIDFAGLRSRLSLSAEADAKELGAPIAIGEGARRGRKNQSRLRNFQ